ncbi:YkyA family protein [Psychrobacillus sp. NPDC096389]|uniref:YkyA family protein n=1 Tax=Psychrobacillus sp. NPDC096389 TaxID=3364490 RepID=UPI003821DB9C
MKKWKYVIPLCFVFLLSACSFGESTEEKLSNILTEIYNLEADYRDVQTQLAETEQKEQANFQSMMELTKDQKEELTTQVEETSLLLEERLTLVEKEAASIKSASEKLSAIDGLLSETDSESEKENIKKIEEAFKNRYTSYDDLSDQYQALASLQEKLYNMLIEDEAEVATIQEQLEEVNKQNDVVQQSVETFNELTTELNKVKEEVFTSFQKED